MSSFISRRQKAFREQEDSTSSTPKQEGASQASSAKSKEASSSEGLTKKESQEILNSLNSLEKQQEQIEQDLKSIKSSLAMLEKSVPEQNRLIKSSLAILETSVSELSRLIKSGHPSPTAMGAQDSYAQLHAPQASQPQPPSPTPSVAPKKSEESVATTRQRKKGWFPAPEQDSNGTYFKELLTTQNRDARFEASEANGEAFFQPSPNTSLDTLRSSEVLERVIQYEGASKEKASHMEVRGEGIAIREEDSTWTVKKNVLIRLS